MTEITSKVQTTDTYFNDLNLELAKRFCVNKIKNDGPFHFDTTGTIFSLGFGSKNYIDKKTNLSIGPFAGGKILVKEQCFLQR